MLNVINLSKFNFLTNIITSVCAATAEILFLRGIYPGALLLSVMLLQPSVLLMGLLGVFAAVIFAQLTQLGKLYLDNPPFLFNPLLAGLSVGYLFQLSPAAIFLAFVAGIMAFVLTWTLSHVLQTFFYLPVLSLPFIIVSWIIHLAAYHYAGLKTAIVPAYAYSIGWPLPLEGFLRTLGLIFFLPNVWVGIAVISLLLVNSRIQLLLAAVGYFLGTTIRGILTGTFAYVYYDPAALNFILVALAIGGFYLLPSPRSYILAAISVGLVALLGEAISVFWAAVALPVHALPYNIITMLLIYLLGLVGHRLLVRSPQSSPEKTLDQELTTRLRYQGAGRSLLLPFSGNWVVWQGVDGQWTHQGLWRYAFDFLIQDEAGCSYSGNGLNLSDYYAFNKPIFSPVRGWVVRVINYLPDCVIGNVDQVNNWGNCVVIYDDRGFYVEISHFAQNSIVIKQGDRIERGTLIGRCGNSGYSPQPHIHIQAQLTPDLGAATIPFSFVNLRVNGRFYPEYTPIQSSIVESVKSDHTLANAMIFPLHSQIQFIASAKGKPETELIVTVKMTADGEFYLDSGKAKLFFWRNEDVFMFHRLEGEDPWLALLWIAIPKLPLVRSADMWEDYLPIGIVTGGMRRLFYQFASSFYPRLASANYVGQWQSQDILLGLVSVPSVKKKMQSSVSFGTNGELLAVDMGDSSLRRFWGK
jgi:urea transporter/murein DD-endopeptidase MepM/ murein hydrolase activator NlpD